MALAANERDPKGHRAAATRDVDLVLTAVSPYNIANIITVGRLLMVPPLMWLIVTDHVWAAFWLFVAAGISDALDGYIAKTFNQQTDLGAILDPLADKALLDGVYIALALSAHLPIWLAGLVVLRDVLIVMGVILIRRRDPVFRVHPLKTGKLNTFAQIILGAMALAAWAGIADVDHLLQPMIWLVAAMTLVSGGSYIVQAMRTADLEKAA
ncbi:MAG: CDP-alcohol phosphatidyltransferase family protein [Geminicoccaceae bacterium]